MAPENTPALVRGRNDCVERCISHLGKMMPPRYLHRVVYR